MSVDLTKTQFSSTTNSFKNTGVYTLDIALPTSYTAFEEKTTTATVTLAENQTFVFATAYYAEFERVLAEGVSTKYWQTLPTFDGYAESGTGPQSFYLYATVNGPSVTFTIGSKNGYGSSETYIAQTVSIRYVTYTVDS